MEKGVLDLASYFREKMVVISAGGRLVPDLEKKGARHYRLPVNKKSLFTLLLIPRVRKIIKEEQIDIVHARSRVPAWVAFFATRGLDAHFVTTAHGAYSPHFFSKVMSWGKLVICPSKMIIRHMIDNFALNEDKVRMVSRWVDLDRFVYKGPGQRRTCNKIITVGRIAPSKGFEYLIEAFRKVVRSNPYLSLHIVGEAEKSRARYLTYLQSLVNRYSLTYNVKFLGYRSDIPAILDQASMLVISSVVEEAFGRVVIEAFAKGVPVVATKVGALEEIIENGKEGLLVFPRNSEALARAMLEILQDPVRASAMAKNARRKAETLYSFSHCAALTEAVYKEAAEIKKILVMKFSSLGDIILAIPALKAIKDAYPKSSLTLLTLKKYAGLFYDCPYVDKVVGVDDEYKKIRQLMSLAGHLIGESFDYIVDLQNNRASHLLAFFSFPRRSFGYDRKLGFLLAARAGIPKNAVSPLDSQNNILQLMGLTMKEKKLIFWDRKYSLSRFPEIKEKDRLIGINISASPKWSSKNWPLSHIRKLIEFLSRDYPAYKVVLLGDRSAANSAEKLESCLKDSGFNLCGRTTLNDLAAVLQRCSLFITQDTAPLHLAQALNIDTIALFGPTDPERHSVAGPHLHVLCKRLDCSFCYKPSCESGQCMKKITPQEVFSLVKKILK